jgi:hypothetical protein
MVFGGALNSDGTDYLRDIRKIENVITFLEKLKSKLGKEEKQTLDDAISVLIEYGNKLARLNNEGD